MSAYGLVIDKDFVPVGEKLKFKLFVSDTSRFKTVKVEIYGKKKERFSKTYQNVLEVRDSIDLGFLSKDGTYRLSLKLSNENNKFFSSKYYHFVKNECGCKSEKLRFCKPKLKLVGVPLQFCLYSNFAGKALLMENKKIIDTIEYQNFYRKPFSYKPKIGSKYSLISKEKEYKLSEPVKYGVSIEYVIKKDTTYFFIKTNVRNQDSLMIFMRDSDDKKQVFAVKDQNESQIIFENSSLNVGRVWVNFVNKTGIIYSLNFLHGGGQLEFTEKEKAMLFDIGEHRIPKNVSNIYELNKYVFI